MKINGIVLCDNTIGMKICYIGINNIAARYLGTYYYYSLWVVLFLSILISTSISILWRL